MFSYSIISICRERCIYEVDGVCVYIIWLSYVFFKSLTRTLLYSTDFWIRRCFCNTCQTHKWICFKIGCYGYTRSTSITREGHEGSPPWRAKFPCLCWLGGADRQTETHSFIIILFVCEFLWGVLYGMFV